MAKPKKDPAADAKPKKKDKKKAKRGGTPAVAAEPVFEAAPVDVPDGALQAAAAQAPQRLLDRLSGARLCYGKPVTGGDLTVVPVARVRVAGGWGGDEQGDGGGGGAIQAAPVGYIEVGPDGARFRPIADPDRMLTAARSLAVTAAAVLGAAAALRSLTR